MKSILAKWFHDRRPDRQRTRRRPLHNVESLESRNLMSADPLPVLLVIADQRDFYYTEYGDTRDAIEAAGVDVRVAATTTNPSTPHAGSGQGADGGVVVPDVALADVDAADYSAIVFVGGWGSSSYQYAFAGTYQNAAYNGDAATKQAVNELINDFVESDKYVSAICHGTTVLAWARVDGVSPLVGKQVSVPYIGSPAVDYNGISYGNFALGQYEQAAANGAIANTFSGQYGRTDTVADDVVVDGRVITAENFDAAAEFGRVIAREVLAAADSEGAPSPNHAPVAVDATWQLAENSAIGTVVGVVAAADPDAGQTLSYAIVGGNDGHAFAIDPASGQITVADAAGLNFEATPEIHLQVAVSDNGNPSLSDVAQVTVQLRDVYEGVPGSVVVFGNELIVQGTEAADTIYIWSGGAAEQVYVWMNGTMHGSYQLGAALHLKALGAGGNDQIFATDARFAVEIHGGAGHDQITGGTADDLLYGDDGVDRIWGGGGDDVLFGDAGGDFLYGREGNDVLVGGDGDDYLEGHTGRDLLLGGAGGDNLRGGEDDDLLIGGPTSHDDEVAALLAIRNIWTGGGSIADRSQAIFGDPVTFTAIVQAPADAHDTLVGGGAADLIFSRLGDALYANSDDLLVLV